MQSAVRFGWLATAALLALLMASLGEAQDSGLTQLGKLKATERATAKRPPPSRPCVGDCVVPSRYKSYEGFLLWSGEDAQAEWATAFRRAGLSFKPARLLVISGSTAYRTRCAVQPAVVRSTAAIGPFYCSADRSGTIFLPTDSTKKIVFAFGSDYRLRDYRERDFAFSLIVAHEWGHHIQRLLRIDAPSIRLELQADCLAGIWAYSAWARSLLERGDITEGLRLASAIGDLPGTPKNDPTAHGTGAQRTQWFMRGYRTGRVSNCDTRSVPVR